MNLDDTKKKVQIYLNSNKSYPLIVDVQTKVDLASLVEFFKVGSNCLLYTSPSPRDQA